MTSHYLIQCWNIVKWTLRNKFQWNFNQSSNIFLQQENAFEIVVCKIATILSWPQCVNVSQQVQNVHYEADNDIWLTHQPIILCGPESGWFHWLTCCSFNCSQQRNHPITFIVSSQCFYNTGIILCMHPANESRRYHVTSSLIGWAHTQNDPCNTTQNGQQWRKTNRCIWPVM